MDSKQRVPSRRLAAANDRLGSGSFARHSKAERHERIVTELSTAPIFRASEIATLLGVSNETIRRDLIELGEQGLLNRTYGGASRAFGSTTPVNERQKEHVTQRQSIARVVAGMVSPGEVLLIGAGSTMGHVARALATYNRDLVVITHAFNVAIALSANPTIKTLMLPGRYSGREGLVYGAQTIENIEKYKANWAILGSSGVCADGLYEVDDEWGAVFAAMVKSANQSIIAADASKFDRSALRLWGRWKDIDRFVTDVYLPSRLAKAAAQSGTQIFIAEEQES